MNRRLVRAAIATVVLLAAATAVAAVSSAHSARTVAVTLNEFHIKGVPKTLPQGATTFQVKNAGKFPHNLTAIYGPVRFKSQTLQKGGTQTFSANLKPGAYILVCTVGAGFHASQGMIARFTVGTFDFSTEKWKA